MIREDIAIIGMACRFPGADNPDAFWVNIRDGVESIRTLSDEELLTAGVSPSEIADPAYVKACPVLDAVDEFDASFFGFSPRDASVMDPAHRLFLEVAWESMENAGRTALPDEGAVGVFAGSGAPYYLMDNVRRNRELMRSMGEFLVRHTNNDMNFLSTRVSYQMDLRGPSVNVQTACSSALVSVHMACESIRRGECVMAIAGGSTVLIPDAQGYMYQEGEIMSPDGHCRPFDANSAGTVFGSGSGCVVLKSLTAALDDGDKIHAVIKGSAINNDGAQRVGFLAPGVDGQAAVVQKALADAGVAADTITYIEAHGTGTSVGDPIEVTALNHAFRETTQRRRFCAIGSVKSNIGHLGEAAGVASLIKAVKSLENRQIPPSLGFESPNPQIDFDDSPFFVSGRLQPWNADGPLRCGVTALGAGGTNCHIILEEAPGQLPGESARSAQVIVMSARNSAALERVRENLARSLENRVIDLADVAYTLSVGRRPMSERCAFVAIGTDHAVDLLRDFRTKVVTSAKAPDAPASVAFMFAGGGAQYQRMGFDLYENEETYRAAVDECLAITNPRLGIDLGALMFAPQGTSVDRGRELERPSRSLPSLFTTEYAQAKLFESWGIEADAYAGHSMGEYVAACLAGVMTLREALELVMVRGRLFESVSAGRMLSVPLPEDELRSIMPAGLDIAAVNARALCVASGPADAIDSLEGILQSRDIDSTRVRIDVAAHSSMLDPVLEEFRAFCRTIQFQPPRVPFVSNVTGDWITAVEATNPDYWVTHLRSTVRFADCLATLRRDGEKVLLEVGPGRTLSTLARAQDVPFKNAFNSMRHPDETVSDLEHALATVGKLWVAGVAVEWSALYDGQLRNRVELPTYPWDHRRHWIDAPVAIDVEQSQPSIERSDDVNDWFALPSWKQALPALPVTSGTERVLIFCDKTGFSDTIADLLVHSGRDVTRVRAGASHGATEKGFQVRPGEVADYQGLLTSMIADRGLPSRVVHAWGVTDPARPATVDGMIEMGFDSILSFAQALSSEAPDAVMSLTVLTSNLQRVGGEELLEPHKALALGPARVMPREYPGVSTRSIDIVLPRDGAKLHALASRIADDITSESTDDVVAIRGSDWFVQSVEKIKLASNAQALRPRGVYLITGGLGGIGYTLAAHLAKNYSARLILTGRGASASAAKSKIAALIKLGGEVEVVQADVTNVVQMKTAVRLGTDRFGQINGVFHAAGSLGDSLMALKTKDDAQRVLAPKVRGALVLDDAIGDIKLDLFVLFSSISSIAGLAGQADYTAANAFLDAFAQERSTRAAGQTISINWSAWRDVGMAANIASGRGAGGGVGEAVHPLLGRRIWSSAEAEIFASDLGVQSQWVLSEHRLRGGKSLMPGTGALEIARAALEARPEERTVEIRDLSFISALVVDDAQPREMRVHLSDKGEGKHSLVIAGRSAHDSGHGWEEHVTADVAYVDRDQPAPLDIAGIKSRCALRVDEFAPDQQSLNMDFGPRWKNLKSIRYGKGEALVELELPSRFIDDATDYRLHPALMDMATGRCEALVPGFDPESDFYVPLSYTRLHMFHAIPSRIFSHVRLSEADFDSDDLIVFDVTITDEAGRVLVDIDEFVMTRVTDRSQLQGSNVRSSTRRSHTDFDPPDAPVNLPPLVRWMEGAIKPAEGIQALEALLADPRLSQVFVTPRPVSVLIDDMRRTQEFPEIQSPPEPPRPTVPVAEIEAVLATHEVVYECVVLQRPDRTGELKLVAYVVYERGEQATVSDLRRFLKARLPENMVPSSFIDLDTLPHSASGGVDRTALPDPFGIEDDYVAPRSETEKLIADIWKEILGVGRVSIYDNFFDAGGHSLLAVRAVVRIDKKIGVRLNQAVMVLQTLEQIAAECDRRIAATAAPAPDAPASTTQARKWFGRSPK